MASQSAASISAGEAAQYEKKVYGRVTRRLIPFLFFCYICAYIDRVNVGFAKLQMQQDLRMSDLVYGTGAGLFFFGYAFFEIPCNLALVKIGARLWLGPIMVIWGIVSGCTMFVRGEWSFYTLRFILGIVECGFFPGVILYLTFWYTGRYRAKMVAVFMAAIPLAGIVGGPISGWILDRMSSVGGLRGWQWLYIVEGIPSIIAGLVTVWFLQDNPAKAKWLSDPERAFLTGKLHDEELSKRASGGSHHSVRDAFRSSHTWILCLVYFGIVMGNYGLQFWMPQIFKESLTKDPFRIGLLTAIPWITTAIAMVLVGHHSDRTGERRWHVALSAVAGGVGLAISAAPGIGGVGVLLALTLATAGIISASSTFWSLPTAFLSGTAASAGIALINSLGNLGGQVSPLLIGWVRDTTKSTAPALLVLSVCLFSSAAITATVFRARRH